MDFPILLTSIFDTAYIFSPTIGFLPQLYSGNITYNSHLSMLTIIANLLKLFSCKDVTLIYQFVVCIFLHLYLLSLHAKQSKKPAFTDLETSRMYPIKHIATGILFFIALLRLVDSISFLYAKLAVLVETTISILHVKMYTRRAGSCKPHELFVFWIVGDFAKIILMLTKYNAAIEYVLGTFMQILINFYVLLVD